MVENMVDIKNKTKIRQLANFFQESNLIKTSKLIEDLADCLSSDFETLNKKYQLILKTFRDEYVTDSFKKELYDHVVDIMVSAVLTMKSELRDKLMELYPLFENVRETVDKTATIAKMFSKTSDVKERYIGTCLIYILKVEGEFDDTIRLLYVLKMATCNRDVKCHRSCAFYFR